MASVYATLPMGFKRPPRFSVIEAASLLAAAEPLRQGRSGALDSAVKKLRQALPPNCEKALEDLARAAAFQSPANSKWHADREPGGLAEVAGEARQVVGGLLLLRPDVRLAR